RRRRAARAARRRGRRSEMVVAPLAAVGARGFPLSLRLGVPHAVAAHAPHARAWDVRSRIVARLSTREPALLRRGGRGLRARRSDLDPRAPPRAPAGAPARGAARGAHRLLVEHSLAARRRSRRAALGRRSLRRRPRRRRDRRLAAEVWPPPRRR